MRLITLPITDEALSIPAMGMQLTGIALRANQHPSRRIHSAAILNARLAVDTLSASVSEGRHSTRETHTHGVLRQHSQHWSLLEPREASEESGTPAARRRVTMQQPGTAAHVETQSGALTAVVRGDLSIEADMSAQALQGGLQLQTLHTCMKQLRQVAPVRRDVDRQDGADQGVQDEPTPASEQPNPTMAGSTLQGSLSVRLPEGAALQLGATSPCTWLLCQLGPLVAVAGTEPATTQRLAALHDVATPMRLPSQSTTPFAEQLDGRQPSWHFSDADSTWRSCLNTSLTEGGPSTPSVRRIPSLPAGPPTQLAAWVGVDHVLVSVHSMQDGSMWVAQLLLIESAEAHVGQQAIHGPCDGVFFGVCVCAYRP